MTYPVYVGLRNITLKEQYRSDRNNIVTEFFVPCLSNCTIYDRCVEFVSLKSLTMLALGFDNFVKRKSKMRIVTGHRFGAHDLDIISKLYGTDNLFKNKNIRDAKIQMLRQAVENRQLMMKIAVPNSEDVSESFTEKIGIFVDEDGDAVAFTGTSNETFNTLGRNFESIDVFTSWNDGSRVQTKIKDFENLWNNSTKYLEVHSFEEAIKRNLLKYSPHWALHD